MKTARWTLIFLLPVLATAAGAHEAHAGMPDPPLHVDPTLKDCSIVFSSDLTPSAFRRFAREFGTASAMKPQAAPPPLGRGRVAIGLGGIAFHVDEHSDAWNDTFAHPNSTHELGSDKQIPMLRARIGVSDRVDVGAYFSENPEANYGWIGIDARWGLSRSSATFPVDLSVRGAYTKTIRVHDMDMHAGTAEVAVGRTFLGALTPYVNAGADLVTVRERSAVVDLDRETLLVPHALGGVEWRLGHLSVGAEAGRAALTTAEMHVSALF